MIEIDLFPINSQNMDGAISGVVSGGYEARKIPMADHQCKQCNIYYN